jgi:hypothetical protein
MFLVVLATTVAAQQLLPYPDVDPDGAGPFLPGNGLLPGDGQIVAAITPGCGGQLGCIRWVASRFNDAETEPVAQGDALDPTERS